MSRVHFGKYARKLRLSAGLTQADLAKELGYGSSQMISNWERGVCYPPIKDLSSIARLFGVNLRTFFNRYYEHHREEDWNEIRGP